MSEIEDLLARASQERVSRSERLLSLRRELATLKEKQKELGQAYNALCLQGREISPKLRQELEAAEKEELENIRLMRQQHATKASREWIKQSAENIKALKRELNWWK